MIDRDVDLEIGEKRYVLSPTLDAMKKINRRFGSLSGAVSACGQVDFEGVCFVIAAGAGLTNKQAEDLEPEVMNHGVSRVAPSCVDYLIVLMNPNDEGEGSGKP